MKKVIQQNIPSGSEVELDEGLMFNKVRYASYSVSGGYAYNWVFARNFLFAASLSMSMSFKKSEGERSYNADFFLKDFNFNDINVDGVGRFGLVWNNGKYYAGTNTILHSYNYKKSQFSTNNVFGSFNLYVGVNFGRKR